jgi:branched-chain amino acid transport system substrate-binding protein
MKTRKKRTGSKGIISFLFLALVFGSLSPAMVAGEDEIRIGFLSVMTGPLAKPGEDLINGFNLFWDQAGYKAGGRKVKIFYADSACNADTAMAQTRRLIHSEKVHLVMGGLCGHEGPAIQQVSRETGIPVLISAGADELTKWNLVETFVRPVAAASQIGHPFGDYLYNELKAKNVTFIGQDYAWGQGITLGAVRTYKELGGKVAKILWTPIGTKDYGPVLAAIPTDTDYVVVTVVGADRIRLFEAWFNFGYDRKYKIAGAYWLHADALPEVDDRALGLISQCNIYSAGIDTPENKKFVRDFIKKYKMVPSWMAEFAYTMGLFSKSAIDAIGGKVEDRKAFLKEVYKVKINAPRGPVSLDSYGNAIQNVYVSKIIKVKDPDLGDIKINTPIKTYKAVSQFWKYDPKKFLAEGPYKR